MAMAQNRNRRNTNTMLALLLCLVVGMSPVYSAALQDTDYSGWVTSTGETFDGSPASSFPPPGHYKTPQQELKHCVFTKELIVVEEKEIVLLTDTLLVDGCLLDCGANTLWSTVRDGPIVTVRNGGHVRNCELVSIKDKEAAEEIEEIDVLDGIVVDGVQTTDTDSINIDSNGADETSRLYESTTPPTYWGTTYNTGAGTNLGTYYDELQVYEQTDTAGFLCDKGDCLLENVSCGALPSEDAVRLLLVRECVLVRPGAGTVEIKGGNTESGTSPTPTTLVTRVGDEGRIASAYGIVVDAGPNPQKANSGGGFEYYTPAAVEDLTKARLLVDNISIEYVAHDGIKIIGGVKTVRITNTVVSNNGGDGIEVHGGYGLEVFAILGGSIERNYQCGIDMNRYQARPTTSTVDDEPKKAEMLVSDVVLKNNLQDGILVVKIDEIVIDGATIEGNGFNGIDVWEAKAVSLQGVVSKFNVQNGLSVEAIGADVQIANSVFVTNGYVLGAYESPDWKKAGVYIWLSKSLTVANSASIGNAMDGFLIYDVPNLSLTGIDANKNGDDGIQIREASAAYGYDYTANSDYLVGAYYYPWHGKDFHSGGGYLRKDLEPPQQPTLGEYDDSDPEIINQHMEWFRRSNIGLLVTSWWGPDRVEDTTTRNVIMEHDHVGNLKVALHYETTGRIKEGDDMSVPQSDIQYMCKHYFDHPNYYRIDGRPVLVIYISRKLEKLGTLEKALLTMRSEANKCGHNLYLVGDAVFAKAPDEDDEEPFVSFIYFDAVTNYDVYGSSGASVKNNKHYAGKKAVDEYYAEQEKWRKLALEQNCRYIPPVSPGYNDRSVRFEKDNPPLSRKLDENSDEGSLFAYQLEKALPLVDPAMDNLILVNSFNEWHEDTQIEPAMGVNVNVGGDADADGGTATKPERLTGGLEYVGYGERYLDILRTMTNRPDSFSDAGAGTAVVYEPSYVSIADVHACKNGKHGISFYITDNNVREDDPISEVVFTPGEGILSCKNEGFDYKFHGGGDIDYMASSNVQETTIVGSTCANGIANGRASNCAGIELQQCKVGHCRQRTITTRSGNKLDDHKIE